MADTDDDREMGGGHGLTLELARERYAAAIDQIVAAGGRLVYVARGYESAVTGLRLPPETRTAWLTVAGTPEGAEANRIVQLLGCHCDMPMVENCTDPRPPVRRGDCPAGSVRQQSATPLKGRPDILAQVWRCSHCGATQMRYRPAAGDGGQVVIG